MSRVEAANEAVVEAMIAHGPGGHIDGHAEITAAALAAADAVMFSSEALERVARAIHDSVCGCDADGLDCDDFGPDLPIATRAAIAALKGEA